MVIEALTSILGGGATGIIGALITRYADYKSKGQDIEIKKLQFENELKLREIDERIATVEWAGRNKIADTEKETSMDVNSSLDFRASYAAEPKMYSNPKVTTPLQNWVLLILDFCRGFIRPGTTVYLLVLTSIIYFMEPQADKARTVETVLYLTTVCITWWFGVRSKQMQKK